MPTRTFSLSSVAFAEGSAIPRRYTCDGADTSPALVWSGVPAGTATLALVVDDPDAGGFVHWVAWGIDPTGSGLPAAVPHSATDPAQGRNGFGRIGYGGPCPPGGTHRYVFRLLALDAAPHLTGVRSAADLLAASEGHILAEARLTGTYRRG
jgi:hypothetical protein